MISKHISIPETLNCRLELELYSEAEERIPFGAQQALIVSLLEQHFKKQDQARARAAKAVPGLELEQAAQNAIEGG
jgi:hypothetical protein